MQPESVVRICRRSATWSLPKGTRPLPWIGVCVCVVHEREAKRVLTTLGSAQVHGPNNSLAMKPAIWSQFSGEKK